MFLLSFMRLCAEGMPDCHTTRQARLVPQNHAQVAALVNVHEPCQVRKSDCVLILHCRFGTRRVHVQSNESASTPGTRTRLPRSELVILKTKQPRTPTQFSALSIRTEIVPYLHMMRQKRIVIRGSGSEPDATMRNYHISQ